MGEWEEGVNKSLEEKKKKWHQIDPGWISHACQSAGQGKERITKCSWCEIRAGRDHSLITVMGKPES